MHARLCVKLFPQQIAHDADSPARWAQRTLQVIRIKDRFSQP
jgi:hypothetical protein